MAQLEYDMKDMGETFMSRPDFIFSTQANFEFANLDPENMPGEDYSLDPVILADSTAVLTRNEDMCEIFDFFCILRKDNKRRFQTKHTDKKCAISPNASFEKRLI